MKIKLTVILGLIDTTIKKVLVILQKNYLKIYRILWDYQYQISTPDKNIIAYKSSDGNELWRKKLEYAGSSPPMTYMYKGEQYLIVNSSGGKYYGFEKEMGDAIYAFKLNYK